MLPLRLKRQGVLFKPLLPLKEVLCPDGNVSCNFALKYNQEPLLVTADAWSAIDKETDGMY